MSISNIAEVILVDASLASNAITLPPASQIPYRVLTFKDLYGRSQFSTITVQTQGTDYFEDGTTTTATINFNYGATTFYAGMSNRWMTLGGTVMSNAQIRSLSTQQFFVSSINGTTIGAPIFSTVIGLGSVGYISSSQLISTVAGLGQIYSSTMGGGGLASIPSTLSTTMFLTSSIMASTVQSIVLSSQQLFVSSIVANNINASTSLISSFSTSIINFATGFGYLTMPDIYPNTVYTSTVMASNLLVGWNANMSPIQFFGFGTYSNSVIAEVSTGATTQELLFFRGSNASDRIRMQTTGSIVFEPGVSARIWPTAPSNVTPAMILNTSSNVGIQIAAPTVPLDVGGAIRGVTFSTQQIATSSIINNPTVQGAFFNSSLRVGVFSTFFGGAMSTSFMTAGSNEIDLFTNNLLRMTILNTGNVGIGTGVPATLLDVAGTGRFTTLSTLQVQMSSVTGITVLGSNSIFSSTNTITFSSGTTAASSFTGRWNDAQYYVLQTI